MSGDSKADDQPAEETAGECHPFSLFLFHTDAHARIPYHSTTRKKLKVHLALDTVRMSRQDELALSFWPAWISSGRTWLEQGK